MFIVIGGSAGGGFVVLIFIPALILTIVGCWKWRKRRYLKRAVNSNRPLPCTPFGEPPIKFLYVRISEASIYCPPSHYYNKCK